MKDLLLILKVLFLKLFLKPNASLKITVVRKAVLFARKELIQQIKEVLKPEKRTYVHYEII